MLTFPTIAEQAIAEFETATKTISLITIANRLGGVREIDYEPRGGLKFEGRVIRYIFSDDTTLEIRGKGKSHRYTALLP